MYFKSLEDKMLYYRSLSDYKLLPNSYVICMLDGRSFSKLIKNKFKKPFDDDFIQMMNETAEYLCENVEGCKFGYVQSDEISLLISDNDTPLTDSFFKYRLCKIQSILASMAASKFNQLMFKYLYRKDNTIIDKIDTIKLVEFDCKAWNVPSFNDAYAWFLYRQNDCIKNSKQQTAQTYLPHQQLHGLVTDEQIKLLKETKNVDWNLLSDDKKYGRFISKKTLTKSCIVKGETKFVERRVWYCEPGFILQENFVKFENFLKSNS